MAEPVSLPMLEFLGWVGRRRRTYAEAMEAWRSTCPRHTVWEDALVAGLVQVEGGETLSASEVTLTPRGRTILDRHRNHEPAAAPPPAV